MRHLDELRLQAYHDHELDRAARRAAEEHLGACPACRERLAALQRLSGRLAGDAAVLPAFADEGAFWLRLAGALDLDRARPAGSWLTVLPSLAFGALGALLELALTATFLVFALSGLGLLPEPAGIATRQAQSLLASPLLERYLFSQLGGAPGEAAARGLSYWQGLAPAMQHTLLLAASAILLGALMAVSAAMLISSTAGWRMAATVRGEK